MFSVYLFRPEHAAAVRGVTHKSSHPCRNIHRPGHRAMVLRDTSSLLGQTSAALVFATSSSRWHLLDGALCHLLHPVGPHFAGLSIRHQTALRGSGGIGGVGLSARLPLRSLQFVLRMLLLFTVCFLTHSGHSFRRLAPPRSFHGHELPESGLLSTAAPPGSGPATCAGERALCVADRGETALLPLVQNRASSGCGWEVEYAVPHLQRQGLCIQMESWLARRDFDWMHRAPFAGFQILRRAPAASRPCGAGHNHCSPGNL